MMEYQVVSARFGWFAQEVNLAIKLGWKPQGGIFYLPDDQDEGWFYQAMIREMPE